MSTIGKPKVPEGLRDMMKDLTKEILKEKPIDIYDFAENYFQSRLPVKENYAVHNFENSSEKYDFSYIQNPTRYQVPVALVYSIIPEGLTNLIKDLIKAVLREQPQNLCDFFVEYFRHIKAATSKESQTSKEINYSAYENYFNNKEHLLFTPYVKCTCGKTFGEIYTQSYQLENLKSYRNVHISDSTFQKKHLDSDDTKTKALEKFPENYSKYSEKYLNSIYIIQKYFRRYLKRKNATTKLDNTSHQYHRLLKCDEKSVEKEMLKSNETPNVALPMVPQLQLNSNDNENNSEDASYTSASTALLSATESGRETSELSTSDSILTKTIIEAVEMENDDKNISRRFEHESAETGIYGKGQENIEHLEINNKENNKTPDSAEKGTIDKSTKSEKNQIEINSDPISKSEIHTLSATNVSDKVEQIYNGVNKEESEQRHELQSQEISQTLIKQLDESTNVSESISDIDNQKISSVMANSTENDTNFRKHENVQQITTETNENSMHNNIDSKTTESDQLENNAQLGEIIPKETENVTESNQANYSEVENIVVTKNIEEIAEIGNTGKNKEADQIPTDDDQGEEHSSKDTANKNTQSGSDQVNEITSKKSNEDDVKSVQESNDQSVVENTEKESNQTNIPNEKLSDTIEKSEIALTRNTAIQMNDKNKVESKKPYENQEMSSTSGTENAEHEAEADEKSIFDGQKPNKDNHELNISPKGSVNNITKVESNVQSVSTTDDKEKSEDQEISPTKGTENAEHEAEVDEKSIVDNQKPNKDNHELNISPKGSVNNITKVESNVQSVSTTDDKEKLENQEISSTKGTENAEHEAEADEKSIVDGQKPNKDNHELNNSPKGSVNKITKVESNVQSVSTTDDKEKSEDQEISPTKGTENAEHETEVDEKSIVDNQKPNKDNHELNISPKGSVNNITKVESNVQSVSTTDDKEKSEDQEISPTKGTENTEHEAEADEKSIVNSQKLNKDNHELNISPKDSVNNITKVESNVQSVSTTDDKEKLAQGSMDNAHIENEEVKPCDKNKVDTENLQDKNQDLETSPKDTISKMTNTESNETKVAMVDLKDNKEKIVRKSEVNSNEKNEECVKQNEDQDNFFKDNSKIITGTESNETKETSEKLIEDKRKLVHSLIDKNIAENVDAKSNETNEPSDILADDKNETAQDSINKIITENTKEQLNEVDGENPNENLDLVTSSSKEPNKSKIAIPINNEEKSIEKSPQQPTNQIVTENTDVEPNARINTNSKELNIEDRNLNISSNDTIYKMTNVESEKPIIDREVSDEISVNGLLAKAAPENTVVKSYHNNNEDGKKIIDDNQDQDLQTSSKDTVNKVLDTESNESKAAIVDLMDDKEKLTQEPLEKTNTKNVEIEIHEKPSEDNQDLMTEAESNEAKYAIHDVEKSQQQLIDKHVAENAEMEKNKDEIEKLNKDDQDLKISSETKLVSKKDQDDLKQSVDELDQEPMYKNFAIDSKEELRKGNEVDSEKPKRVEENHKINAELANNISIDESEKSTGNSVKKSIDKTINDAANAKSEDVEISFEKIIKTESDDAKSVKNLIEKSVQESMDKSPSEVNTNENKTITSEKLTKDTNNQDTVNKITELELNDTKGKSNKLIVEPTNNAGSDNTEVKSNNKNKSEGEKTNEYNQVQSIPSQDKVEYNEKSVEDHENSAQESIDKTLIENAEADSIEKNRDDDKLNKDEQNLQICSKDTGFKLTEIESEGANRLASEKLNEDEVRSENTNKDNEHKTFVENASTKSNKNLEMNSKDNIQKNEESDEINKDSDIFSKDPISKIDENKSNKTNVTSERSMNDMEGSTHESIDKYISENSEDGHGSEMPYEHIVSKNAEMESDNKPENDESNTKNLIENNSGMKSEEASEKSNVMNTEIVEDIISKTEDFKTTSENKQSYNVGNGNPSKDNQELENELIDHESHENLLKRFSNTQKELSSDITAAILENNKECIEVDKLTDIKSADFLEIEKHIEQNISKNLNDNDTSGKSEPPNDFIKNKNDIHNQKETAKTHSEPKHTEDLIIKKDFYYDTLDKKDNESINIPEDPDEEKVEFITSEIGLNKCEDPVRAKVIERLESNTNLTELKTEDISEDSHEFKRIENNINKTDVLENRHIVDLTKNLPNEIQETKKDDEKDFVSLQYETSQNEIGESTDEVTNRNKNILSMNANVKEIYNETNENESPISEIDIHSINSNQIESNNSNISFKSNSMNAQQYESNNKIVNESEHSLPTDETLINPDLSKQDTRKSIHRQDTVIDESDKSNDAKEFSNEESKTRLKRGIEISKTSSDTETFSLIQTDALQTQSEVFQNKPQNENINSGDKNENVPTKSLENQLGYLQDNNLTQSQIENQYIDKIEQISKVDLNLSSSFKPVIENKEISTEVNQEIEESKLSNEISNKDTKKSKDISKFDESDIANKSEGQDIEDENKEISTEVKQGIEESELSNDNISHMKSEKSKIISKYDESDITNKSEGQHIEGDNAVEMESHDDKNKSTSGSTDIIVAENSVLELESNRRSSVESEKTQLKSDKQDLGVSSTNTNNDVAEVKSDEIKLINEKTINEKWDQESMDKNVFENACDGQESMHNKISEKEINEKSTVFSDNPSKNDHDIDISFKDTINKMTEMEYNKAKVVDENSTDNEEKWAQENQENQNLRISSTDTFNMVSIMESDETKTTEKSIENINQIAEISSKNNKSVVENPIADQESMDKSMAEEETKLVRENSSQNFEISSKDRVGNVTEVESNVTKAEDKKYIDDEEKFDHGSMDKTVVENTEMQSNGRNEAGNEKFNQYNQNLEISTKDDKETKMESDKTKMTSEQTNDDNENSITKSTQMTIEKEFNTENKADNNKPNKDDKVVENPEKTKLSYENSVDDNNKLDQESMDKNIAENENNVNNEKSSQYQGISSKDAVDNVTQLESNVTKVDDKKFIDDKEYLDYGSMDKTVVEHAEVKSNKRNKVDNEELYQDNKDLDISSQADNAIEMLSDKTEITNKETTDDNEKSIKKSTQPSVEKEFNVKNKMENKEPNKDDQVVEISFNDADKTDQELMDKSVAAAKQNNVVSEKPIQDQDNSSKMVYVVTEIESNVTKLEDEKSINDKEKLGHVSVDKTEPGEVEPNERNKITSKTPNQGIQDLKDSFKHTGNNATEMEFTMTRRKTIDGNEKAIGKSTQEAIENEFEDDQDVKTSSEDTNECIETKMCSDKSQDDNEKSVNQSTREPVEKSIVENAKIESNQENQNLHIPSKNTANNSETEKHNQINLRTIEDSEQNNGKSDEASAQNAKYKSISINVENDSKEQDLDNYPKDTFDKMEEMKHNETKTSNDDKIENSPQDPVDKTITKNTEIESNKKSNVGSEELNKDDKNLNISPKEPLNKMANVHSDNKKYVEKSAEESIDITAEGLCNENDKVKTETTESIETNFDKTEMEILNEKSNDDHIISIHESTVETNKSKIVDSYQNSVDTETVTQERVSNDNQLYRQGNDESTHKRKICDVSNNSLQNDIEETNVEHTNNAMKIGEEKPWNDDDARDDIKTMELKQKETSITLDDTKPMREEHATFDSIASNTEITMNHDTNQQNIGQSPTKELKGDYINDQVYYETFIGNQNLNIVRIRNFNEGLLGSISGQRFAETHLRSFWKEYLMNNSTPLSQYDYRENIQNETTSTETCQQHVNNKEINSTYVHDQDNGNVEKNNDVIESEIIRETITHSESSPTKDQKDVSRTSADSVQHHKDVERIPRYFYGVPESETNDYSNSVKRKHYKEPTAFTIPIDDFNKKRTTKTAPNMEKSVNIDDKKKNLKKLNLDCCVDSEPLLDAETPTKLFQDLNAFEYEIRDVDLDITYTIDEIIRLKMENDSDNNCDENVNDVSEYSVTPEPMLQTIIELSESETPKPTIDQIQSVDDDFLANLDKNSDTTSTSWTTGSKEDNSFISDDFLDVKQNNELTKEIPTEQPSGHSSIGGIYEFANESVNNNRNLDEQLEVIAQAPSPPNFDPFYEDKKETAATIIQKAYRRYIQSHKMKPEKEVRETRNEEENLKNNRQFSKDTSKEMVKDEKEDNLNGLSIVKNDYVALSDDNNNNEHLSKNTSNNALPSEVPYSTNPMNIDKNEIAANENLKTVLKNNQELQTQILDEQKYNDDELKSKKNILNITKNFLLEEQRNSIFPNNSNIKHKSESKQTVAVDKELNIKESIKELNSNVMSMNEKMISSKASSTEIVDETKSKLYSENKKLEENQIFTSENDILESNERHDEIKNNNEKDLNGSENELVNKNSSRDERENDLIYQTNPNIDIETDQPVNQLKTSIETKSENDLENKEISRDKTENGLKPVNKETELNEIENITNSPFLSNGKQHTFEPTAPTEEECNQSVAPSENIQANHSLVDQAARKIQKAFRNFIKRNTNSKETPESSKTNWFVGDEPIVTKDSLTKTMSEISFEETEAYVELTTNPSQYLVDSSSNFETNDANNISRTPTAPVSNLSRNSVELVEDNSTIINKDTVSALGTDKSGDTKSNNINMDENKLNRSKSSEDTNLLTPYSDLINKFINSERQYSEAVNHYNTSTNILNEKRFSTPDVKEISKILFNFNGTQEGQLKSPIPYEHLQEQRIKKSIEGGKVAVTDTSSSSDVDDTEDSLSTKTVKLHKPDMAIIKMQQRQDSTIKMGNLEKPKDYNFDEPLVTPIDILDTDEEGIVVNKLQREETRESSAQSDVDVIFGSNCDKNDNSTFLDSIDIDETFPTKGSLKRVHTIAGDGDTKSLLKNVTIDESIKYIEPPDYEVNSESLCLDDVTAENIRQKMMAYSLSEADSDYFDKNSNNGGDITNVESKSQKYDDFNISTALVENCDSSTETESTIVSAVTKIQAGARGYLTRKRLGKTSIASDGKSMTHDNGNMASFGNAAISESLEHLVQEAAAKRIQRVYRKYYKQKISAGKRKAAESLPTQFSASMENTLSQKRSIMLQRGDALRNNSTPDEGSSSSNGSEQGKLNTTEYNCKDNKTLSSCDEKNYIKNQSSTAETAATIRAMKIEENKKRWFAMRQNSMPVQIDSEVLRVIPKYMRKKIKSAEGEKKKRRCRLPMD